MSVAFASPKGGDTVATAFDAFVDYDFGAFKSATVRVYCSLFDYPGCTENERPAVPPYYDVDPATDPTGQLDFQFDAPEGDYCLKAWTVPDIGKAEEKPIYVRP